MSNSWTRAVDAHKAQYREQIIDAAVDLAGSNGPTRITMARLAEQAGIGRATLYKYFPDVEHALLAHVEREIDRCATHVESSAAREDLPPIDRLRACLTALAEYFASDEHRTGWGNIDSVGMSEAANSLVTDRISMLLQPIIAVFAEGLRSGDIRAGLDAEIHGRLIFKMIISLHPELTSGTMTSADAVDAVWQMVAPSIAALPGAVPPAAGDRAYRN